MTKYKNFGIIHRQLKIWCSSQVVRPRSATPLSAGSNPACTSKEKGIPFGIPFFFLLEVQTLDLKRFRRLGVRKPVHIPHSKIEKLAFQAQSVGICRRHTRPAPLIYLEKDDDTAATIISACTGRTKHILDRREKRICNCCYDQVLRWNRRTYIADQPWYTLNLFLS